MNALFKLFFPVPYPQAVLWHIILGGIVAAVIGYFFLDYRGYGYTIPIVGALISVAVASLVYWSQNRPGQ